MGSEPWTIERICEALGAPTLVSRFLGELNRAPADKLMDTFTKWQRIAEGIESAFDDNDPVVAAARRGEEPPGQWTDITDEVRQEADRIRARGAA